MKGRMLRKLETLCDEGIQASEIFYQVFGPSLWLFEHQECCQELLQELIDDSRVFICKSSQRCYFFPQTGPERQRMFRILSKNVSRLRAEIERQQCLMVFVAKSGANSQKQGEGQ